MKVMKRTKRTANAILTMVEQTAVSSTDLVLGLGAKSNSFKVTSQRQAEYDIKKHEMKLAKKAQKKGFKLS